MNELTDRFAQLLHSKWGSFTQWATGAIVGYLIALAAKKGFDISPEAQEFLTEGLTIGFAFIATFAVQWYQAKQTKKIQRALGVTPDAWPGPETVEAAEDA